jgi:hypothetical protein
MGIAGRYRRVFVKLWLQLRTLDDGLRVVALYLLTGPQTNRVGLYRLSPAAAAEDLNLTVETFRERLGTVCATFDWTFDSTARVMWIPSWWRFNTPENPNVLKGCLDDLSEVPETPLLSQFASHVDTLPATLHPTFVERMAERYGQRSANQEQDQEQDQEHTGAGDAQLTDNGFDAFWRAFPKHVGKGAARRAWDRRRLTADLQATILAAVATQRRSEQWQRDNGRYIPNPATWLNEERWDDQLQVGTGTRGDHTPGAVRPRDADATGCYLAETRQQTLDPGQALAALATVRAALTCAREAPTAAAEPGKTAPQDVRGAA